MATTVVKRGCEWSKTVVRLWASGLSIEVLEVLANISLLTQASVVVEILENIAFISLLLTEAGISIPVSRANRLLFGFGVIVRG
jgi:hypothetical protein